jgi:hypothetical protein
MHIGVRRGCTHEDVEYVLRRANGVVSPMRSPGHRMSAPKGEPALRYPPRLHLIRVARGRGPGPIETGA